MEHKRIVDKASGDLFMARQILTLPNSPGPSVDDGVVVVLVLQTPSRQCLDVLGCFPDPRQAFLQGA